MLNRSDLRIVIALALSMAIHGAALMWTSGLQQNPAAVPARKKITFELTARPVAAPASERKIVEPRELEKKDPVQQPAEERLEPPPAVRPVRPKPEPAPAADPEVSPPPREETVRERPKAAPLPEVREEASVSSATADAEDNPVVVEARPLYRQNPPPPYPGKARHRRLEGTVILEVQVSSEGSVDDLRIKESSGHRILDQAAMSSVRKWVFEPGRRNGLRIAMTVLVPVRFALQ
ncbi:MAG: energy transducer TonB [Desulfobulbaceae bacterium]|nr:energy transducer TonB [Desulfobulbaceae bacterium]